MTAEHPKFRKDIIVSRREDSGGKQRVILQDPVSEKYYRLSEFEFVLLKGLDGSVTLDEAVEKLKSQGRYYDMAHANAILEKAARSALVIGSQFSEAQFLAGIKDRIDAAGPFSKISSIYFLYLPLLNPDGFLGKTLPLFRLLANRYTGAATGILGLGAIYLFIMGFPRIRGEYLYFFNLSNMLCLWGVVAFTKLFHEFAHAYTAKHFGLHVPKMGIAFLLFLPCLYCDTTDAWRLADRRQRMLIGAAGILAELVLAIFATYVWYFSKPGLINSVAFYLVVISLGSTILFNGNPLIRFDGYFILMDLIRRPNLATKSFSYLKYLFLHGVLGSSSAQSMVHGTADWWLYVLYGVLASVYRVFLLSGIIAAVYWRFDKFLGVLLSGFALALFVIRPLMKGAVHIIKLREQINIRPVGAVLVLLVAAMILPLLILPWSWKSVYPCSLQSAQTRKLTVPLKTKIEEVYVREGEEVKSGRPLFKLDPTELELALVKKQIERDIITTQVEALQLDEKERSRAQVKAMELRRLDGEIAFIRQELDLAYRGVPAVFSGVVTRLDPRSRPGFKPGEGAVIGEFKSATDCVVEAILPGRDIGKVSKGQQITVWFPLGTGKAYRAKVTAVRPYSEKDLHDSVFSSHKGGEIPTEPAEKGKAAKPLESQYVCTVTFHNTDGIPLGTTGRLVVSSPPRSALNRVVTRVVQTFNRESLF